MVKYSCRELNEKHMAKVRGLIADAPPDHTIFIRPALANLEAFDGWWYGALADGDDLEAVMCISNRRAAIYGANSDALGEMGRIMEKTTTHGVKQAAARHQLYGEARGLAQFWSKFRAVEGRELTGDTMQTLLVHETPLDRSPSKRIRLGLARPKDARLVYEFTAELILERDKLDPRRAHPKAHSAKVQRAITEKRQLLGKDGDKPVFVAELVPVDDDNILVADIYVPRPFRGRKRLVAGALYMARKAPIAKGKRLMFFAGSDAYTEAGAVAGYKTSCVYRWINLYG